MKSNCTTIDDIGLYMARGCDLHPLLYDHYLNELDDLVCKGKVSLVPHMILETYHRKLSRAA